MEPCDRQATNQGAAVAPSNPCRAPLRSCDRAIGGGLVSPSATCAREYVGRSGGTARDKKSAAPPGGFACTCCALRLRDLLVHLRRALWRVGQAGCTGSTERGLGVVRELVTEGTAFSILGEAS